MKSFIQFTEQELEELYGEWDGDYNGMKVGSKATINSPGHAHHGKTGRIMRHQSTDYGVEIPNHPGLHWLNASHLSKA